MNMEFISSRIANAQKLLSIPYARAYVESIPVLVRNGQVIHGLHVRCLS